MKKVFVLNEDQFLEDFVENDDQLLETTPLHLINNEALFPRIGEAVVFQYDKIQIVKYRVVDIIRYWKFKHPMWIQDIIFILQKDSTQCKQI